MPTVEEKVMIVVGRSDSIGVFVEEVNSALYDNFTLKIADQIEDEVGIDGKIRFLGFIVGEEMSQYTFEQVGLRLNEHQFHSSDVFSTMEEAFNYAHAEYGFGSKEEARIEKLKEVADRFPPATATEIEQFEVFTALMATHKVHAVRALFQDEPVVLLVKITESPSEMRVSPLAVLVNDFIAMNLEYEWEAEN